MSQATRLPEPSVVWFTGLSGAGKSTIAREVCRRFRTMGASVEYLDGDEIRWTDVRSRTWNDPADQLVRELLHSVPWRRIEDVRPAEPLPEGVYRWEITEAELIAAGVDAGDAYTNAGLSTFTVRDGRWLHHIDGPASDEDCGGPFEVQGSRIAVDEEPVGRSARGAAGLNGQAGYAEGDDERAVHDGTHGTDPYSSVFRRARRRPR